MLLFLSGCLLLADAPEGALCEDADCAPYACADYGNECEDICINDGDCAEGYVCAMNDCAEPCVDDDCPNGFACDDLYNECADACYGDNDCQPGWECCQTFDEEECPEYGECY